jgi:hypothetical protein
MRTERKMAQVPSDYAYETLSDGSRQVWLYVEIDLGGTLSEYSVKIRQNQVLMLIWDKEK